MSTPVRSEARSLLVKAMATGRFDVERIAAELVATERLIGRYCAGDIPIPLERQLCLARFIIDNIPELARQGRNLLGKVHAQIRFLSTDTVTHQGAPPPSARAY